MNYAQELVGFAEVDEIPIERTGCFIRSMVEVMEDYDDACENYECQCGRPMFFSEDAQNKIFGGHNTQERREGIEWYENHYMMKFSEWEIF